MTTMMKPLPEVKIADRVISRQNEVYFIADIAANHDGSLERAKKLIYLAKEAGADAAKFQHFRAAKIVSDYGFKKLGGQVSHQAKWKKSVYQVYEEASVPWDWTPKLKEYCDEVGLHFFSAPYDLEAVDMLDEYVPAYKIGSGDITWPEILEKIAQKNKPVILATGASNLGDVQRAVKVILKFNPRLILLQCNTNYTGSRDTFRYIRLKVLETYQRMYPGIITGLSDHSPGFSAVLGAVALGGRVIEKHFTDDQGREGPDHAFSLEPKTWREMVEKTKELFLALGDGNKDIEENEQETVIIQRRCLRAAKDILAGTVLKREDIDILRPATPGAIFPYEIEQVVGKKLLKNVVAGEELTWEKIG